MKKHTYAAPLLGALLIAALAAMSSRAFSFAQSTQTAAPPAANAADDAKDRGWPRKFETPEYDVVVYEPQVDSWPKFERVTFRAAISIARRGQSDRQYGNVRVSAATKVSVADRLVLLSDRRIESATFPEAQPDEAKRLSAAVLAIAPPDKDMTVSLDRLIAQMDVSQVDVRKTDVNLAPPKIITSTKPAVMVIFMGKPRFKPVAGTGSGTGGPLMFAINTNWDLFLDSASSKYYLLDGKSWLMAESLTEGSWTAARSLPASINALPADANWDDVRKALPLTPAEDVPSVYLSNEPAELLVLIGAPEFEPIEGTGLMQVANTESELFYDSAGKQYYLLAAGRWFKSGDVAGPWTASSAKLPEGFRKIPESANLNDVLACVPGTPQANDAMILASIPEKATINRSELTVNVTYNGAPSFQPIEKTTVQYASNSPFDVFLVSGKYYCCSNAVWFIAPTPTGAWAVCDSVPPAIYTIPPTNPKYNVTYVTVYESTPTTVVTGYTAGYSGATVAATGAVMFGLGILVGAAINDDDDCCWAYRYPSCAFSYGCGACYHGGCGGYVAGGAVYGPYGGAGRYAAYNPSTGVYSRGGAVYGPNGAAGYRTAYNPSTGNAGYRAGGSNAYGSWGRGAVTNGDDWVRGGYQSGARGTVGAVEGSGGAGAAHAEGRYGNGATVARSQDGDLYAGKDGNVYKKSDDGWEQASSNKSASSQKSRTGQAPTERPTERANAPSGQTRQAPAQAGDLQRESSARSRGEQSASRSNESQRSAGRSASGGGGSRGGGSRGGGGRR